MHALKTLVAATAATLAMTACASGGSTSNFAQQMAAGPVANGTQLVQASNQSSSARGSASMPATVRVANYNWMDVNVYAVQGGIRTRLGTVTSMSNGTFQLPARMVQQGGGVRLLVDPIGSTEGYMTDGFQVNAGQQVSFNVQNALQFSSVSVSSR